MLLFCNHTHLPLSPDMSPSLASLTPDNHCLPFLNFVFSEIFAHDSVDLPLEQGSVGMVCLCSTWYLLDSASTGESKMVSVTCLAVLILAFSLGVLSAAPHGLCHVASSPKGPLSTWPFFFPSLRAGTSLHVSSGL